MIFKVAKNQGLKTHYRAAEIDGRVWVWVRVRVSHSDCDFG